MMFTILCIFIIYYIILYYIYIFIICIIRNSILSFFCSTIPSKSGITAKKTYYEAKKYIFVNYLNPIVSFEHFML